MTGYSRRTFLKLSAGIATGLALGGCGLPSGKARTLKIGYVSPQSGPLAGFGEVDSFIIERFRAHLAKGLAIAGKTHPVEILVRDTQSDANHAADLARNLIIKEAVDLMVVASTPETTNPVSDTCEVNGVPCISTVAPWQPWYFRNPQIPEGGYRWTYHFFWGLEDIIEVFLNLWESRETNRIVGGMWPNDGDGLAWSNAERGFPPALQSRGFQVVDPGRYANLSPDFSEQIKQFKQSGVEIVTGVMIPPDLVNFIAQCRQLDFRPKFITVGKAALFPSVVEKIADGMGEGITTEVWWSPQHPFSSSLSGISAEALSTEYRERTGKQWTQPLGFINAAFEVAVDALTRTMQVDDKSAIATALRTTNLQTVVGPIAWGQGPVPNVAKTPLVGGQWMRGSESPWELTITVNQTAPNIPTSGTTQLLNWMTN